MNRELPSCVVVDIAQGECLSVCLSECLVVCLPVSACLLPYHPTSTVLPVSTQDRETTPPILKFPSGAAQPRWWPLNLQSGTRSNCSCCPVCLSFCLVLSFCLSVPLYSPLLASPPNIPSSRLRATVTPSVGPNIHRPVLSPPRSCLLLLAPACTPSLTINLSLSVPLSISYLPFKACGRLSFRLVGMANPLHSPSLSDPRPSPI